MGNREYTWKMAVHGLFLSGFWSLGLCTRVCVHTRVCVLFRVCPCNIRAVFILYLVHSQAAQSLLESH